jgi:hypothetical protein
MARPEAYLERARIASGSQRTRSLRGPIKNCDRNMGSLGTELSTPLYLGLEMGRAGSGFVLHVTQPGGSRLAQRYSPAQS